MLESPTSPDGRYAVDQGWTEGRPSESDPSTHAGLVAFECPTQVDAGPSSPSRVDAVVGDSERLASLASYRILDTPAELAFDDIVELARHVCDTPVALVSFVSADRQWFKARVGFGPSQTTLDQSVCAHVLVERDILVIPDLTIDPRSRCNPLVTGEPHIRFYAGVPLTGSDGHCLGSLCVIDTEPRPAGLTAEQARMLRALTNRVVSELELRRTNNELRAAEAKLSMLIEAVPIGLMLAEAPSGRILMGNARIREILGHETVYADGFAGYADYVSFHADGRQVDPSEYPLARVASGACERDTLEVHYQRPDGRRTWLEIQGEAIKDADGVLVGAVVAFSDIDVRKRVEANQDFLNQEISHRLKNTLALVQAIATQTLRSATSTEQAQAALVGRLVALGKAHDILLSEDACASCVANIVREAVDLVDEKGGRVHASGPSLPLPQSMAVSLALILHELATNAAKYGALSISTGRVEIAWSVSGGTRRLFELTWKESGGPVVTAPARKGFGSKLIGRGLTADGTSVVDFVPTGLQYHLTAPI